MFFLSWVSFNFVMKTRIYKRGEWNTLPYFLKCDGCDWMIEKQKLSCRSFTFKRNFILCVAILQGHINPNRENRQIRGLYPGVMNCEAISFKQDACSGVRSACQGENAHKWTFVYNCSGKSKHEKWLSHSQSTQDKCDNGPAIQISNYFDY